MNKIAVIGSHGAGKSTLCYQLASYYKSIGKNVDLVQERIRFSPFPYNENMKEETALWAYHAQVARELESQAKGFDTIICDRTAFDCLIYARYWNIATPMLDATKKMGLEWMKSYNTIFFVYPDLPLQVDSKRSSDLKFQEGIHAIFLKFITHIEQHSKIKLHKVKSSEIFQNQLKFSELLNA
jgi:thymidylate kinase